MWWDGVVLSEGAGVKAGAGKKARAKAKFKLSDEMALALDLCPERLDGLSLCRVRVAQGSEGELELLHLRRGAASVE